LALILDTGPLFAVLNRGDSHHRACRALLESSREHLVIPAPVLPELNFLIRRSLHPGVLAALLDDILAGAYHVENVQPEDYARIRELCDLYGDSDIGFVDAAVFAIVERLREPKLATLDRRHFGVLRPRHVDSLTLLPG
jgi:predicted nucleic acid-binding protein